MSLHLNHMTAVKHCYKNHNFYFFNRVFTIIQYIKVILIDWFYEYVSLLYYRYRIFFHTTIIINNYVVYLIVGGSQYGDLLLTKKQSYVADFLKIC